MGRDEAQYCAMPEASDYRSDKMDSLEGYGIARARWKAWHDDVPDDVYADIYFARQEAGWPEPMSSEDWEDNPPPDEILEEIATRAVESSELLGFFIAWHLAGGFAKLQDAGWHRATIHRKIRRFRDRYGVHPDEFRLPWMKLDLVKAWDQELIDAMHPSE